MQHLKMQREAAVYIENVSAWEENTSQIQNPPQCIKKCGVNLYLIRHNLLMLVSQGFGSNVILITVSCRAWINIAASFARWPTLVLQL